MSDKSVWLYGKIRPKRNKLLAKTDHYGLPDEWSQLTDIQKQDWQTYRQALRDLPTVIDQNNPKWPTRPTWIK